MHVRTRFTVAILALSMLSVAQTAVAQLSCPPPSRDQRQCRCRANRRDGLAA